MKTLTICLATLVLFQFVNGQHLTKVDSLINVFESDISDTAKLSMLDDLVPALLKSGDSTHLANYLLEGQRMADRLDNDSLLSEVRLHQALFQRAYHSLNMGIDTGDDVIEMCKKKGFKYLLAKAYMKRGNMALGDKESMAMSYFDQGLALGKEIGDSTLVADVLYAQGNWKLIKSPKGAFSYFEEGLRLTSSAEDSLKFLLEMGRSRWYERKFNAASQIYDQCSALLNPKTPAATKARFYDCMAGLHLARAEPREGLLDFKKTLKISEKLGDLNLKGTTLGMMALNYEMLGEYDLARGCALEAVSIWELLPWKGQTVRHYGIAHYMYLESGKLDSATYLLNKAMRFTELHDLINDNLLLMLEYHGEGLINRGLFSEAVSNYELLLEKSELALDTIAIADSYLGLAKAHRMLDNLQFNLDYQQKALGLLQLTQLAHTTWRPKLEIATTLLEMEKPLEVSEYLIPVEKALLQNGEKEQLTVCWLKMGDMYYQLNEYDLGFQYYQKSLEIAEKGGYNYLGDIYFGLGNVYNVKGSIQKAIESYEKALSSRNRQNDDKRIKMIVAEKLYPLYEVQGQSTEAYETFKMFQANKDSIFSKKNAISLAKNEVEYAYEKEKQEQALIQQRERAEQEQKLLRQKWFTYSFVGAFVLMLLLTLAIYRNYRNKQKANKLLAKRKDELEELDQFKSRFFTNISHELRTPLTLIGSPLENLLQQEQNTFSPETVHTLQLMQRSTGKLKGLVNDILDLSKLESGKLELQEEPVEIKTFISRIASNYTSMAEQLEIDFIQSTSQSPNGWVLLDGKRFEKVLNNLLFNAIKYTPTGGKIELVARQEGEHLEILVSDTGQGIAEVDLPHIFERYFQSKQPDAPIQGGTGIGLAIAHELAILMGGDLTVESELGNGTTFTLRTPYKPTEKPTEEQVELPLEEEQLEDHAEEEALTTAKADDVAYHVLVVEDNLDMQKYVQQLLSKDYNVSLALNGKKALKAIEKQSFDLVITDAMMPEMDGYTLLQKLKDADQYRNIPVIMLTALNFEDTKLKALSIGVDDYLTKPFSPKELVVRARNLIARYEARKEWAIKEQEETPAGADAPKVENQPSKVIYKADLEWLKEVEAIIRRELENNAFQITELADHLNLSRRQFQRKINKLTGLSPKQYQQEIALQKGRELLEDNTYTNVSAISFSVGISNPSRFSDMYAKRFGKRPSEYFREMADIENEPK